MMKVRNNILEELKEIIEDAKNKERYLSCDFWFGEKISISIMPKTSPSHLCRDWLVWIDPKYRGCGEVVQTGYVGSVHTCKNEKLQKINNNISIIKKELQKKLEEEE